MKHTIGIMEITEKVISDGLSVALRERNAVYALMYEEKRAYYAARNN